jgi:serine O-acetyltransferase
LLCYPGLHALWFYRLSHWLWVRKLLVLGRFVSHLGRFFTGIEIHPGATIGHGLFIDHGLGTVIGETAEIGEHVTLYHNVTLGGVSWRKEKRHPTVEDQVVIGAGAQVLGPITIGARSRIGANAVVVRDVPSDSVVTGIPGRVTSRNGVRVPDALGADLEHNRMPDTVMEAIQTLNARVAMLETELSSLRQSGRVPTHDGALQGSGSYQGPWGI